MILTQTMLERSALAHMPDARSGCLMVDDFRVS
jgi:hypothetical protein